ncbi:primosomal protein N' [Calidithermus timidus]|uniref:primosomal protein N' family DNA-binding protein n=1 Tax=Calidithermus timidus TaxID=307124 RepID=UPI00037AE68F|nr:primosomal protein N' [Calidithermus timidus]
MQALRVALPLPLEPMSYLPPHTPQGEEALEYRHRQGPHSPSLGRRVVVPWRGELRVGIVVGLEDSAHKGFTLRHAVAYLEPYPWLRPQDIHFLEQAAQELFAPLGSVLADLLPFLEPPLKHRLRLLPGTATSVLPSGLESLAEGWQEGRGYDPKLLDYLREGGVLEELVEEQRPSRQILVPLKTPDTALSAKGRLALETLHALGRAESMAALAQQAGVSAGVVRGLVEKGYAAFQESPLELPIGAQPQAVPIGDRPAVEGRALEPLPLPPEAQRISGGRWLLRLRALSGLVREGPTLVLFPEVAQLKRCLPHFPHALPFHGELSPELRRQIFHRIAGEGLSPGGVVLSTYQGLLLPFSPRRIVVMEEGSDAYKLSAGSRAFIPYLAELRAKLAGIPYTTVSLVSSLESEWELRQGHGLPLQPPRLHLLDMRQERGWPISGAAVNLLQQVAEKKRQAVVLVARRGYSALLRCKHCDWKAMCPDCALPLRLHRAGRAGRLLCHQCGHEEKAPPLCPQCGSEVFEPRGPGVEWLLEALQAAVPSLPRYRYTAEEKDRLEPLLAGEPGLLVGTTAILRAPTLPELALVLLPYAEGFLLDSDFRASERYHRLLWQLTELHPRRRPLLALQTFDPAHPAHLSLQQADPEGFLRNELLLRRALDYPPVQRMIKLELSHAKEPVARDAAMELAEFLRGRTRPGELLGPAPAPVPKVRGQYVFHLLLKGSTQRLRELMQGLPPARARLRIDPDPHSFVGLLED